MPVDIHEVTAPLRARARSAPDSLSPDEKNLLTAIRVAGKGADNDRMVAAYASKVLPFGPGQTLDLQHPTGILVSGPGATEIIQSAQGTGDAYGNSAVFAIVRSYCDAYIAPTMRVYDGPFMDIENSEVVELPTGIDRFLQREINPWMTIDEWEWEKKAALLTDGNAYLIIQRAGAGSVLDNITGPILDLWPIPYFVMEPVKEMTPDGRPKTDRYIDYYAMDLGHSRKAKIPPENVIHFREGRDPKNQRKGFGRVRRVVADHVKSDYEADQIIYYVLRNSGHPGLVFSPGGSGISGTFGPEVVQAIKESVAARTTGAKRGEVFVLDREARVDQFMFDPKGLDLSAVWVHLESRISAVIGWPAALAGLQSGLEHMTYSNLEGLQRYSTRQTLVPAWKRDRAPWESAFRKPFGLGQRHYIAYDLSEVEALRETAENRRKWILDQWNANAIPAGVYYMMLDMELPEGAEPTWYRADIEKRAAASALTINMGTGPAVGSGDDLMDTLERDAKVISAAKVGALQSYAKAVSAGEMDYDAAVAQIVYTFNVDRAEAQRFLGPRDTDVVDAEAREAEAPALPNFIASDKDEADEDAPDFENGEGEPSAKAADPKVTVTGAGASSFDIDVTDDYLREAAEDWRENKGYGDKDFAGALFAESEAAEKALAIWGSGSFLSREAKARPPDSWGWDAAKQRYRWPNTGRAVPYGRVSGVAGYRRAESEKRLRALADRLSSGKMTRSAWEKAHMAELKLAHTQGYMLGRGGLGQMTADDRKAIKAALKREAEYLKGFGADLKAGKHTARGIADRAGKYARASQSREFADARHVGHKEAGFTKKRRVTSTEKPCEDCSKEAQAGYVDIDRSGWVLGATACASGDACDIEYKK